MTANHAVQTKTSAASVDATAAMKTIFSRAKSTHLLSRRPRSCAPDARERKRKSESQSQEREWDGLGAEALFDGGGAHLIPEGAEEHGLENEREVEERGEDRVRGHEHVRRGGEDNASRGGLPPVLRSGPEGDRDQSDRRRVVPHEGRPSAHLRRACAGGARLERPREEARSGCLVLVPLVGEKKIPVCLARLLSRLAPGLS